MENRKWSNTARQSERGFKADRERGVNRAL